MNVDRAGVFHLPLDTEAQDSQKQAANARQTDRREWPNHGAVSVPPVAICLPSPLVPPPLTDVSVSRAR